MNRWLVIVWLFILSISCPLWAETDKFPNTIKQPHSQAIYYFDKNWKNIPNPISNGFYRKVLEVTADGYIIQDFYQNSDNKQSDPIFLRDKADLTEGGPKSIEGKLVLWHENGQKSMEVLYKNSQKEGLLTSWHENGYKEIEQNYINGKENGQATYWNEEGQKQLEFNFKDGNFDLVSVWKNNRKISESHYLNNKKEGISTYWYKDGTTKAIEHYHQNKLNGLYTSFYPDGNKQSEFDYENNAPMQINFWYPNQRKAAYLKRTAPKQLNCSIWDEQGMMVYQGDNTERCILTVRNIFNEEIAINY